MRVLECRVTLRVWEGHSFNIITFSLKGKPLQFLIMLHGSIGRCCIPLVQDYALFGNVRCIRVLMETFSFMIKHLCV